MKRGKWYWGLISIVLVTLLAANAGCVTIVAPDQTASTSGFITYNDTTNGFSISYPKDWERAPQELTPDDALIGFRSLGTTRTMLLVYKSFLPYVDNLQTAYEDMKTVHEAEPGYLFISKDDITIDGIPGFKYVFQVDFNGSPSTLVYVYLVQGSSDWLVQLGCTPAQSYTQYKPTFDTIINSFHISGAATATPPTQPTTTQSGFLNYNDTTNGFSISYPKDWDKMPQTLISGVESFLGGEGGIIVGFWAPAEAANFTVAKASLPYEQNLEAGYEEIKLGAEQEKGYVFISKDYLTIDGIPAVKYVYQSSEITNSTQMYIFLVQGKVVWFITFTCPPQSFKSLEPTFDTVANSFHISGAVTSTPSPVTSTPSSGLTTYTDDINGFSIAYPKDWKITPQELFGEDVIVGFYKGIDQADPSVYTVSVFEWSSGMTVEDFYGALRPEFETWEDYSFIAKNNLTINGIPAIKYTFVYRNEGQLMKVMLILLAKDNSAWLLTFASSTEYFATHESTFNTIAGSFKIIDTIKYKE